MALIGVEEYELIRLQKADAHLNELINRGVDNWDGYVGPGVVTCCNCCEDCEEAGLNEGGLCEDCEEAEE